MVDKHAIDPYDSLWDWMAYDLRHYRIRNGMTLAQVGDLLHVRKQTVNGYENGISKINAEQAELLDKIWDTGGHFHRMHHFARAGHDPDWFRTYTGYEARARVIKVYGSLLVPGLLQTPEYARALLTAGGVAEIDKLVERRMGRQDVLTQSDPPAMSVLLDEAVIDRPIGGPKVMREQLARLLEASQAADIIVRVVPRSAGAHVGLDGAFMILTVDRNDIAYTEANGGGRLVPPGSEVEAFKIRFEKIGADALPQGPSRALMTESMERMT